MTFESFDGCANLNCVHCCDFIFHFIRINRTEIVIIGDTL
jgi:hypothetical protein